MIDSENNQNDKTRVNEPAADTNVPTHTLDELTEKMQERIEGIQQEFIDGFHFIRQHPHSVTFFGSARLPESNPYYQKAQRVGKRLAEEGIDVMTGGGPGVMEAANRGAHELRQDTLERDDIGDSLGFNIELPAEQVLNPYVTRSQSFAHFFTRKVALTFSAETYIFFPGGFGTLDEFFEILTLVQTRKIEKVPIVLVGEEYWGGLYDWIHQTLLEEYETVSKGDLDLFTITDDEDKIVHIVKNAPMRDE